MRDRLDDLIGRIHRWRAEDIAGIVGEFPKHVGDPHTPAGRQEGLPPPSHLPFPLPWLAPAIPPHTHCHVKEKEPSDVGTTTWTDDDGEAKVGTLDAACKKMGRTMLRGSKAKEHKVMIKSSCEGLECKIQSQDPLKTTKQVLSMQ